MFILTNYDLIRTYWKRFALKLFYAGERSVFSERFKVPLSLDAVSPLPPLKVSLLSLLSYSPKPKFRALAGPFR